MSNKIKVKVENLNLYYGENHALKDVNMDIQENAVTAFIGPSGCGKSTFLKTLNRMNDLVDGVRIDGKVLLMVRIYMIHQLILQSFERRLEWYSSSLILFL